MAFWSAILKAGESKKVDVAEMDIVLTIGNVALNNGAEGKAAKIFATVEDEDGPQKVLLATLRTPACEQAVLDITFPTDVTLSVEGSGEVHLAGIIAPADDGEEDDDAMYGGFPSDEEMGSGDEDEDGEEGSGDEEGSDIDSMENDPRVQELGSDESDEAPAAKKPAPKLLTRKPEGDADAAAPKKQKVDNKKAAADAKPKAAAKPAADASKEGVAGLSCAQCGKAFNAPAGLDQHMKAKHGAGGDAKPAAAEKPAPATPKAAAKPAAAATPKGATPKAAPKPAAAGTPKGAAGTPKGAAGTPKGKK